MRASCWRLCGVALAAESRGRSRRKAASGGCVPPTSCISASPESTVAPLATAVAVQPSGSA
eukprot:7381109-Prymnesium_polylepis.1